MLELLLLVMVVLSFKVNLGKTYILEFKRRGPPLPHSEFL